MNTLRRHLPEALALIGVLLLAAWLRFGWTGVNSFAGDEARISLDALRLVRGGEFVYIAQQSSTGIPFLPASVWMFAPPYALSPDPLGATLYVSLISLLTIAGTWGLARRWGIWAGLTAALFLAASPYAVFYGRNIWQPNLLPALGLAWAWAGWLSARDEGRTQRIGIVLNCFLGAFIFQVHFAGLALALGSLYLFVRLRWWRHLPYVLLGGGLAALCTLPYVYYLLTQAPQVLGQFGQVGAGAAQIDLEAARNLLHLGLGYDWGYLALGQFDTVSRTATPAIMAGLLLGLGLVVTLWSLIRRTDTSPQKRTAQITLSELTVIWLISSPLFFLRHTTPVLPHYQLIALPALAVLAAAAVLLVKHAVWRVSITGLTAVLAILWTAQIAASLDRAAAERPPESALSSILSESRSAALSFSTDEHAIFMTHGDDLAVNGEAAVFRALGWEHPDLRIINGETTLIVPPHPAVVMATLAPFQAWEELVSLGLNLQVEEHERRPPALPYVSARLGALTDEVLLSRFTAQTMALENGTALEGWRVRPVGNRLRVSTLWRVTNNSSRPVTQQFHHLFTTEALNIEGLQADRPPDRVSDVPLSIHQWRAGDRVIVMADFFDVPAGDYTLRTGQYTLADLARIPTADGDEGVIEFAFRWQG